MQFFLFINCTSLNDVVLFIDQFHQFEGHGSFFYQFHQFEGCSSFY